MTLYKLAIAAGAFVVAGFAFSACATEDLEEETFGNIVPGSTFGQSESEFRTLIAGAYIQLFRLQGNHNSLWSMNEVSTDEFIIPQRGVDWEDGGQWFRVHTHAWTDSEPSFNNAWNKLYGGISRFTQLIEDILPAANPELAAQFTPELRGLRALYYMYLIDNFGNVPLVLSGDQSEDFPSTRSREEVYNYIVAELQEIIPQLPAEAEYARITRSVAQGILAKMYLNSEVYTGTPRWQECIDQVDAIIASDNYILEDNYFTNFDANNIVSRENMMVIPYDRVNGRGFNIGFMTLHYRSQETFAMTAEPWNGYATLQEFYDSYDDDDVRKGTPGVQQERSNFLVGPQFALDGVTRLIDPGAEASDPDGPPLTFMPEISEIRPSALRQAGARFAKYEYEEGTDPEGNNDYPLLRYGDMLLMKAECLLRLNGDDDEDALEIVNLVRARNFDDSSPNAELSSLNLDDMLAVRGREMMGEYFRRQDLIRFGQFATGSWQFKDPAPEFRNLFPIPAPQLQANPNLVQNPGY